MATLDPEYLEIDFNTLVSRLRTEIQNSNVFRDVNYEGSNISMLMELMAYIGELNTFYLNKIAKNTFEETSDIYETSHALAKQKGYDPKGYISAYGQGYLIIDNTDLDIIVGDSLIISHWAEIKTSSLYNGELIYYSTTSEISNDSTVTYAFNPLVDPTNLSTVNKLGQAGQWVEIPILLKQGRVRTYTSYGRELVDNQIILPLKKFDYDSDITDTWLSIEVTVDGIPWKRVTDFYAEMTGLEGEETKVFKFEFDKYQRYKVVFSNQKEVPGDNDSIVITCLETLATNGNIGALTMSNIVLPDTFLYNIRSGEYIDGSKLTIQNFVAFTNAQEPETLTEIKDNSRTFQHSQFRNVTRDDYIATLETRSDVIKAMSWGEMEIAPSGGDTREYNKVHLTVIPTEWNNGSISTHIDNISREISVGTHSITLSGGIIVPTTFDSSYNSHLLESIENTKMLTTYEIFEVPEIVYFWFDLEVRVKRLYTFPNVKDDIQRKLEYYFQYKNRNFGETIDFMKILNYIIDPYEYSEDGDTFSNVRGIENLEFRDIGCSTVIYEPNSSMLYPQYTVVESTWIGENRLRQVKLNFNQFPGLVPTFCQIYNTL